MQVSDQRSQRHTVGLLVVGALVAALLMAGAGTPIARADGSDKPAAPAAFQGLSSGNGFNCALRVDGSVRCWGNNAFGRLGLGDTTTRGDAPGEMGAGLPTVDLGTGRTAIAVAAGSFHACALLDDGSVKCWGQNGSGRLGIGDTASRGDGPGDMGDDLPAVALGAGRTAVQITAGNDHTCAVLDDGSVKCWGGNDSGQLGLGDTVARGDGPGEMGDNLPAVDLGAGRTATSVVVGNEFTCAVLDDATTKCWGDNGSGRLGLGDVIDRGDGPGEMGDTLPALDLGAGRTVQVVSAGDAHACALLDDATVKCWGENSQGRLGLGDTADRGDAGGEMGDALPSVDLGSLSIAAVTAGAQHTCAVSTGGAVRCWGNGASGRLGLGDPNARGDAPGEMGNALGSVSLGPAGTTAESVVAGGAHTCALIDTAAVKCWGDNAGGQLGVGDTAARGDAPGEMGSALAVAQLAAPRQASAVSRGSCALLDGGLVKCWGNNEFGRLGLGDVGLRGHTAGTMGDDLDPVPLGGGRTATAVSTGAFHACAVLDNGAVKCWGYNSNGQLGLGDTADRGDGPGEMGDALPAVALGTGRTATAVSVGSQHTCAILDDGSVKCWGDNSSGGRLGLGDTASRGDGPGEMGDALPAVDLGPGRTAEAIGAGSQHTCALLDNGSVKCWGNNSQGRLGLGDTVSRGDNAGEMGGALPEVDLGAGRTATALAVGVAHTCALLDDSTVKCWGNNGSGRLGLGDTASRGDAGGEMGGALPVVGLGAGRTAMAVTAGSQHSCAVLDNSTVKCWGENSDGLLGVGDTADRGDSGGEMGDALPVVALGTGRTAETVDAGEHTCVILDDGSTKCWGRNLGGALGIGSTDNRGDAAGEMGDALPALDLGSAAPIGVRGRVTSAGSGARVPGAFVVAMRATDFSIVSGAVANRQGDFALGLPPGSYFVYLIDPSGAHVANFHGPPTTVGIKSVGLVTADPVMTPTRGSVGGTITEAGSGDPIPGAVAITLLQGNVQFAVVANAEGEYHVPGLVAASHHLGALDPAGANAARFRPDATDVATATPIAITAGATASWDAALPAVAPTPGGSALTGTIVEEGTGTPLPEVLVVALRASDYQLARATFTDGAGSYSLNVQAGGYKLAFVDSNGLHPQEWHDNLPNTGLASALTVTAPGGTGATMSPNFATLEGTVTDDASGAPLAGAWVIAIGPTGVAGGGVADADGNYRVSTLPPGTYRAAFVDPVGGRGHEYHDDAVDFAGATPFNLVAAGTTVIDAAL